jgi:hypothetical protein
MILIAIDHAGGAPRRGAFELVSAARSPRRRPRRGGARRGPEGAAAVAEAMAAFVPRVVHVDDPALDHPSHERRTTVLAAVAADLGAEVVLLGAGRGGQAVGPRLALRLGGSLLEDAAAVRREGSSVVAERLAYLSRALLTVRAEVAPVVISLKPGAFQAGLAGRRRRQRRVPRRGDRGRRRRGPARRAARRRARPRRPRGGRRGRLRRTRPGRRRRLRAPGGRPGRRPRGRAWRRPARSSTPGGAPTASRWGRRARTSRPSSTSRSGSPARSSTSRA